MRERHAPLIVALCLVVTVAYGALYYGFAVLITEPAAGGEFSHALLSAAYGGAVLTAGLAAIPIGRIGDRAGVRWVMVAGAVLGAAGLVAFSLATDGWQVLAAWWLVLGPAAAMTFYEPAYIAIQHAFGAASRARALAVLTLAAGFSGPLFTWATGALVVGFGWRDATRVLAAAFAAAAPVAALLIPGRPAVERAAPAPAEAADAGLARFRDPRLRLFTVAAILAYGAIEATIVHRIARFQELGFSLSTVTAWAAVSGLLTLPGRFLLPLLGNRLSAPNVLALVLSVLAAGTGLMISGHAYWQMAASFVLFGLVFGAALPLRALVMGAWTATAVFGTVMGMQAAMIAFGRAGMPALTGALRDLLGGYGVAMAVLTALLVLSAVLVVASGRRRP
jgi:sugar phosphate permease